MEQQPSSSGVVAVTGATGHIGNVLVRTLTGLGWKVRVIIPPGEDTRSIEGLEVDHVAGDIRNRAGLERAFSGVDTVYHLAGLISISPGKRRLMHEVNVEGTRNVVQAARAAGVRRLVYTSSVHAFVEPQPGTPTCETTEIDPNRTLGDYAQSKARATREVRQAISEGLDAVIVFPSGVIGPYDYRRSEMGQLVLNFMTGRLPAYIDGEYDFVDVRDVVDGLLAAGTRGRAGEGYMLSGNRVSVEGLMHILQELSGRRRPRFKLPFRLAQFAAVFTPLYYRLTRAKPLFTSYSLQVLRSNCLMDNSKAGRELGFTPRPLRRTITDSIQWFREVGWA